MLHCRRAAQTIDRPFLKPQPIDLAQPLTPNALGVIAVLENPDLRALRSRACVTEAQSFAARLLPDPTVSVGFDKLVSGPDALNRFAGQLGLDIAALRKRCVNGAAAEAARVRVRPDIDWAEWQIAGAARMQEVLSITLAGARDTAGNLTLGPQIGLSLPLWNRNRGGVALIRATREQLRGI